MTQNIDKKLVASFARRIKGYMTSYSCMGELCMVMEVEQWNTETKEAMFHALNAKNSNVANYFQSKIITKRVG